MFEKSSQEMRKLHKPIFEAAKEMIKTLVSEWDSAICKHVSLSDCIISSVAYFDPERYGGRKMETGFYIYLLSDNKFDDDAVSEFGDEEIYLPNFTEAWRTLAEDIDRSYIPDQMDLVVSNVDGVIALTMERNVIGESYDSRVKAYTGAQLMKKAVMECFPNAVVTVKNMKDTIGLVFKINI